MRRLRYISRFLVEFVKRFKGLITIGLIFGIGAFVVLRLSLTSLFSSGKERIGLAGRYHVDDLPKEVSLLIGEGLTRLDGEGNVVPALASSWESPDNGRTWVFHLAERKWHDKEKVSAKDINYGFADVTVERPDDSTLIFKLANPYSPFPMVVAKPVFKKGLLGTGEWQVKDAVLVGSFFQKLTLSNGTKIKIFKFYPTEDRLKLGYRLGEVDKATDLFDQSPFENWQTAKIFGDVREDRVVTLFFNTADVKLSEKALRQALAYAIDKDAISNDPRAVSPINPMSFYFNPQVKKYEYDEARARELLDSLSQEVKEDLTVNLVTAPVLLKTAEKIADFWRQVGVDVEVQVSLESPSEFQVYLAIFEIPPDPDQYSVWHSTQASSNITNFASPRIDKLLEDGRTEFDRNERKKIYLDFQRFLVEDSPAAFLYHPTAYTVERK